MFKRVARFKLSAQAKLLIIGRMRTRADVVLENQGTQAAQLEALCIAKLAQALRRFRLELRLNSVQQAQSLGSDARDRLALIVATTCAADEAASLQTIDKPRYVRRAFHHALGNFAPGMACRRSAENSQHVILGAA